MPDHPPLPELKHAGDPRLIAGIYNHCDRWCDRCRFQEQCLLRCDERRRDALMERGVEPGQAYRMVHEAHEQALQSIDRHAGLPASRRLDLDKMWEDINREPTPEEARALEASIERQEHARESHHVSVSSREYGELAVQVLRVIRPIAESRSDQIVLAALETVEHFALMIPVKTARAIGGLVARDADDDDEWMRSDANGTAKLVRLIVAESIEAWRVLMAAGHGTADGVPAAMVSRLERLDAGVADAFPRAMEFVRAGFDEPPTGCSESRV